MRKNWARGPLLNLWQPKAGDGCVLWLPGQDDAYSSTIRDRSGNNNHGQITGATWTRLSSGLWALSGDGSDDKVVISNNATLQITTAISVEIWINPDAAQAGTEDAVVSKRESYVLYYDHSNAAYRGTFVVNIGATWPTSGVIAISNGVWSHLVGTYDGTTLAIYKNGALGNSNPQAGLIDVNANALRIAEDYAGSPIWGGGWALCRIYNRALPLAEIQSHFRQERHLFGV